MKLGAGCSPLRFSDGFFPVEGFSREVDPLHARVLLVDGADPFALVSLEVTSLPAHEVESLQRLVGETTGTPESRIWICATHTFSAPHLIPESMQKNEPEKTSQAALRKVIHDAVREACQRAVASMTEACVALGQGNSGVNINRDIETHEGWWVGNTGDGFSDKTLTVMRADAAGKPIAFVLHYGVQSSVLDGSILSDGGKGVSPDLAGMACRELERQHPGAVALFLAGAAGDQAPIEKAKTLRPLPGGAYQETDLGEDGIGICHALGKRLAQDAAEIIASLECKSCGADLRLCTDTVRLPAQQMPPLTELQPTRNYAFIPAGETDQEVSVLSIGPLAIVGVRPELGAITARHIAQDSPFPFTLTATMVNGGAKYMAQAQAYDRMTYEAMNSPFAKGAAERLEAGVRTLLAACGVTAQRNKTKKGGTP